MKVKTKTRIYFNGKFYEKHAEFECTKEEYPKISNFVLVIEEPKEIKEEIKKSIVSKPTKKYKKVDDK